MNQFLLRYAFVNQKANSAQTYVCCQGDVVVGFYSLVVGSVDPEAAPSRVMKGLARHPVPVMILARLAVDRAHQRRGLGRALLRDALLRTAQAEVSQAVRDSPSIRLRRPQGFLTANGFRGPVARGSVSSHSVSVGHQAPGGLGRGSSLGAPQAVAETVAAPFAGSPR
ncbi:MAG TPA: GNAT family N-acetyltransferase [Xanthomonadaceae bacterium]|nr:GNAT family N-acetyltransferase [Xanthomonadaceae bacterium]